MTLRGYCKGQIANLYIRNHTAQWELYISKSLRLSLARWEVEECFFPSLPQSPFEWTTLSCIHLLCQFYKPDIKHRLRLMVLQCPLILELLGHGRQLSIAFLYLYTNREYANSILLTRNPYAIFCLSHCISELFTLHLDVRNRRARIPLQYFSAKNLDTLSIHGICGIYW